MNASSLETNLFHPISRKQLLLYSNRMQREMRSRGQSEIYGLFLIFVAPPRKKNLVTIMSWGHVLGS